MIGFLIITRNVHVVKSNGNKKNYIVPGTEFDAIMTYEPGE